MDPIVLLFGLGVGVLVGTTGIGGGSIMTPLLILVLGTKPVVAIGTDLAYAAITKTVGGDVTDEGRVELLTFVREQSVTVTAHRSGLVDPELRDLRI